MKTPGTPPADHPVTFEHCALRFVGGVPCSGIPQADRRQHKTEKEKSMPTVPTKSEPLCIHCHRTKALHTNGLHAEHFFCWGDGRQEFTMERRVVSPALNAAPLEVRHNELAAAARVVVDRARGFVPTNLHQGAQSLERLAECIDNMARLLHSTPTAGAKAQAPETQENAK